MSKVFGAGIIGAGIIFEDHALAYNQLAGRVRLVGLADIDEARLRHVGEQFFIPYTTTDYHALLARNDVDVVSICTPPTLHEEMIAAALEAGKCVVCEKPLGVSLAATDRIVELASKYPGKLSTVYQFRYANASQRALWCRDQGQLGKLAFGRFQRQSPMYASQKAKGWWGSWAVGGGGAVMTQAIHELDLILQIFGPVRRVVAIMGTVGREIESEDTFSAVFEHESGAITTCNSSVASNIVPQVNWSVFGTQAGIHQSGAVDCFDRKHRIHTARQLAKEFPVSQKKTFMPEIVTKVLNRVLGKVGMLKRTASGHAPYMRAVIGAMEAGEPLPVGPEEARQSVELTTAIYTSALSSQPVSLPLGADAKYYDGITTSDYDGRR